MKLTYSYDSFRRPKIILGIILTTFSILTIFNNWIQSFVTIIISLFLFGITFKLEIDTQSKTYRIYRSIFGIKSGVYKELKEYSAITLLVARGKRNILSPRFISTLSFSDEEYDVYITNSSHRKKLFIQRLTSKEKANQLIELLEKELELPYEKYNPKLTQATQNRIRRRR